MILKGSITAGMLVQCWQNYDKQSLHWLLLISFKEILILGLLLA